MKTMKLDNDAQVKKVKGFVQDWFAHYEALSNEDYFLEHITPDATFKFVEGEYSGPEGFSTWYKNIMLTYRPNNEHRIEAIFVVKQDGYYHVDVSFRFLGETKNGQVLTLDMQEYFKVEMQGDGHMMIHENVVYSV